MKQEQAQECFHFFAEVLAQTGLFQFMEERDAPPAIEGQMNKNFSVSDIGYLLGRAEEENASQAQEAYAKEHSYIAS